MGTDPGLVFRPRCEFILGCGRSHIIITLFKGGSITIRCYVFPTLQPFFNRPSPYGNRRFLKWIRFFFVSVGLTYEQSAVKLVVRVLKSGTVLYKTHAHISLLNATFVCSCLVIYSI